MPETVLILGSHGRFGRHATQAFSEAGWQVRSFDRAQGDLSSAIAAADVVLNAWNPPGYHLWNEELAHLHKSVADAARRTGATVILPGNVYVYGPKAPSPWTPTTPHLATNPLGQFRRRIEEGYRTSGAQVIILRCGDFIDHEANGNWFETYITPTAHKGFIRYPGDPNVAHAWAYLPDAARATVALAAARMRLGQFEDVPFEGFTLTGNELAEAIAHVFGHPVTVKPFQWGMIRLLKPFMPSLGGVFEVRYLWSLPHRLDGARLAEIAPDLECTSVDDALRTTLAALAAKKAA